jgi:DNA gyrase subunit B
MDIEAVRKRPGMYVGPTDDGSGLHKMVFEVADNAIKEGLAGHCSHIEVTLNADGSVTVCDDGRGLPVDIHTKHWVSKAEVIMTRMIPGDMLEHRADIPGGFHTGNYAVNALSAWLELRIWRDGREHFMRFLDGHAVDSLKVVGDSDGKRGTEITFLPSPEVFAATTFDFSTLERRFRDLGFLSANATLVLLDERGTENKQAVISL